MTAHIMELKPTVFVSSYYDRETTDPELQRLEPAARVVRSDFGRRLTEPELLQQLKDVRVALISDEVFNERVFQAAPNLHLLVVDGVGVDSIDLDAATRHGVIVNNAPFVHEANGDFTLGLILAVMRRIVLCDRELRAGGWSDRERFIGRGLRGSKLGLLGFGRAARCVAQRAAAFGAEVLAYSPRADAAVARELGVKLVGYEDLLVESDVLSVHVTLNDSTRGMVGASAIEVMKTGAFLINTSRGAVVDEAALVAALKSGKLAGAGIDVFQEEPPPLDHPLFAMENVVVTAHIASDSFDAFRAVFEGAVNDILLFLAGRRPTHVINTDVLDHPNFASWRQE